MSHNAYALATGTNGTNAFTGEVGVSCLVGSTPIVISQFGAFVDASAAWGSSKVVNLWNGSTHALIGTVTILKTDVANSLATQVGQYVYKAITPIYIAAGTSLVISANGYSSDKFSFRSTSTFPAQPIPTFDGGSGLLTSVSAATNSNTANTYPGTAGTTGDAYGAGSFVYDAYTTTISISPTSANPSTPVTVTATGSGTSWVNGTTTFSVATGTNANAGSISGLTITSATSATFTYNPPATAGTVIFSTNQDFATATLTVNSTSSLTPAVITLGTRDSTGITLTGNSTAGTGPFTYQWQSCATSGGTFTNVAGANTQTYKFSVAAGAAPLYVRCTVTDSTSTAVNSFGYAAGAVYSGSPILPFAVTYYPDPLNAVIISDSTGTTAQNFDLTTFTNVINRGWLPGASTVNNQSIGGTTVQGWDTTYTAAMITALSAGKYVFMLSLGVNDSKSSGGNSGETLHLSAALWATHVASICSQILAASKLAGSRVVLIGTGYVAAPTQYNQWDDISISLLNQYNAAIPALCNGTTILQGQLYQRYNTFVENQTLFADGVHETGTGGTIMATQYAVEMIAALTGGVATSPAPSSYSFVA